MKPLRIIPFSAELLVALALAFWLPCASAASNGPSSVVTSPDSVPKSLSPYVPESLPSSAPPSSVLGPPSSTAGDSQLSSMDTLDDKHRFAIGDRVSFRIKEDLEDPAEPLEPKPLIVTDSGEMEIPYIGRVPAESKTCKELAREIKTLLEKDYYYQATVLISIDLRAKTRGKVYIVGPVRIPGPQEIPTDEILTLSKAIMRAGGFNDFADRRNVKLTRKPASTDGEKKTFVVDVGEIFDKGKIERDLPLEPGDLILVPERTIRF